MFKTQLETDRALQTSNFRIIEWTIFLEVLNQRTQLTYSCCWHVTSTIWRTNVSNWTLVSLLALSTEPVPVTDHSRLLTLSSTLILCMQKCLNYRHLFGEELKCPSCENKAHHNLHSFVFIQMLVLHSKLILPSSQNLKRSYALCIPTITYNTAWPPICQWFSHETGVPNFLGHGVVIPPDILQNQVKYSVYFPWTWSLQRQGIQCLYGSRLK